MTQTYEERMYGDMSETLHCGNCKRPALACQMVAGRCADCHRKYTLTPIPDLDLMIRQGWGDTPQVDLPADWRTRVKAI